MLMMSLANIVFVFVGLYSKLTLSFCGLIVHSTYMISIIGGFFIYVVIDFFMRQHSGKKTGRGFDNEKNLDQTTIMIIASVPLLLLFVMGIYSLVLLLKVDDELEARRQEEEERRQRERERR